MRLILDTTVAVLSLQRFVEDCGGSRACAVGTDARGLRGLVATADLAPGDVALRVPLGACLVEQRSCSSHGGEHWAARLAARLSAADDPDHDPYRAALPEPPRVPTRWEDDDSSDDLQNNTFAAEVDSTFFWRYEQGVDLDALDLVCSRTLAFHQGDRLALVPVLDMANHAPASRGGGCYALDGDDVCLVVGDAAVAQGQPVLLDYGDRPVDDFLLHYGFVPEHHPADSLVLPASGTLVSWREETTSAAVRAEARALLEAMPTTLADDLAALRDGKTRADDGKTRADDATPRAAALQYRVAKKQLLSFAAGLRPAAPETSALAR